MSKKRRPAKRPRFSGEGKWLGPRVVDILRCARKTSEYIWSDESLRLEANLVGEFRVWRSTTGEGALFDDPEAGETLYAGEDFYDAVNALLRAWEDETGEGQTRNQCAFFEGPS